uniref:Uncharacterized protein n=1 Tax=Arundo donax TaxID=35708 RepID=A0A0A8ZKG9_ARUDO
MPTLSPCCSVARGSLGYCLCSSRRSRTRR